MIILDNASFHRKTILPGLASKQGSTVLFLPLYSPNLNPIEFRWACLKQKLREILHHFDSFDLALCAAFQVDS